MTNAISFFKYLSVIFQMFCLLQIFVYNFDQIYLQALQACCQTFVCKYIENNIENHLLLGVVKRALTFVANESETN